LWTPRLSAWIYLKRCQHIKLQAGTPLQMGWDCYEGG